VNNFSDKVSFIWSVADLLRGPLQADAIRPCFPSSHRSAPLSLPPGADQNDPIRRAKVGAEDDLPFAEEKAAPLSGRDRDHFLDLLAFPPAPTPALKAAVSRHRARRG